MILTEDNYVKEAEKAIQRLCKNEKKVPRGNRTCIQHPDLVTTSKIRNLLAMTADIYNEVINMQSETLTEDIVGQINYMKIRFVYEAGREPKVAMLVKEAQILEHLEEIAGQRSQYILFSRYMEALVAYRKFYDDNAD